MKKISFFYILLVFSTGLFAAEKSEKNKDYLSLKVTPEISLMNGTVKEYVFNKNCLNDKNVESRLDWDVKNIILFNIGGDFDILDYVNTGIKFSIAAPGSSGRMQDYDWLNSLGGTDGVPASWLNDSPSDYTNYSTHSNNLEKYMKFSINLGGNIMLPAQIKLTPFISYHYDYIGFLAENGYGKYKDSNWKQKDFEGRVITYRQESNSFATGFKLSVASIPRTFIYYDFCFSPALTFTNAMDYHYERALVFWDKFTNIWQLETNLRAQYVFNQNHSAGLAASIQYVPMQKGITQQKILSSEGMPVKGKWLKAYESGGLERFLWTVSLSYSFSL